MPALDWKNKTVYKDGRVIVPITVTTRDVEEGQSLLVSRLHTMVGRKTKGAYRIQTINLAQDYLVLADQEEFLVDEY